MGLFTTDQAKSKKRAEQYRDLIRKEAIIGGQIFGPIPRNGRREFFCLDPRTWVWHEETVDEQGVRHIQTTRYDIRSDGIVKCLNNGHYTKISLGEAENLQQAVSIYKQRVMLELYSDAQ